MFWSHIGIGTGRPTVPNAVPERTNKKNPENPGKIRIWGLWGLGGHFYQCAWWRRMLIRNASHAFIFCLETQAPSISVDRTEDVQPLWKSHPLVLPLHCCEANLVSRHVSFANCDEACRVQGRSTWRNNRGRRDHPSMGSRPRLL